MKIKKRIIGGLLASSPFVAIVVMQYCLYDLKHAFFALLVILGVFIFLALAVFGLHMIFDD